MSEQAELSLLRPVLLILRTTGLGLHVTVAATRAWRWSSTSRRLVETELRPCDLDEYFGPAATELFLTTGHVAGAATEKPGSQPIAQEPACPICVLPEAPVPVRRP